MATQTLSKSQLLSCLTQKTLLKPDQKVKFAFAPDFPNKQTTTHSFFDKDSFSNKVDTKANTA